MICSLNLNKILVHRFGCTVEHFPMLNWDNVILFCMQLRQPRERLVGNDRGGIAAAVIVAGDKSRGFRQFSVKITDIPWTLTCSW